MNIYSDKADHGGEERNAAVPYAVICIFYWPRPQPNFSGGRFITAATRYMWSILACRRARALKERFKKPWYFHNVVIAFRLFINAQ